MNNPADAEAIRSKSNRPISTAGSEGFVMSEKRRWDLVAAGPVGLAAAVAAAIMIGCSSAAPSSLGNVAGNPSPTPPVLAPTVAPSPTANPFPGATSLYGLTSTAAGVTYYTDFEPAFALEPGAGWGLDHDLATLVSIHAGPRRDPTYSVQFLVPTKVVQPGTAGPIAAPSDLIAWLEGRPDLSLSAPKSVTIGGITGMMVQGGLRAGAALNPEGGVNLICANVSNCGYEGGELIGIGPTRHEKFVVLDVRGTTVVIALVGPRANAAEDRATLDAVLGSVTFAAP
jgi:hypothetical protein